jgi:hypothetical protein
MAHLIQGPRSLALPTRPRSDMAPQAGARCWRLLAEPVIDDLTAYADGRLKIFPAWAPNAEMAALACSPYGVPRIPSG